MLERYPLRDRQTQTGSTGVSFTTAHPEKTLEHTGQVCFWNTGAAVHDFEQRKRSILGQLEGHPARCRGVFERVIQQNQHQLLEAVPVALYLERRQVTQLEGVTL